MDKHARINTSDTYKDLRLLGLSLLATIPIFLASQLLLRNGLYGLPIIIAYVIVAMTYAHRAFMRAITMGCTLLLYTAFLLLGLAREPFVLIPFIAISLCSFVPGAVLMGRRIDILRVQSQRLVQKSVRDKLVSDINTRLITLSSVDELRRLTLEFICDVSACSALYYERDGGSVSAKASYPDGLLVYEGELDAAKLAFELNERTGYCSAHCAYSSFYYLPVAFSGRVLAVIGVLAGSEHPLDEAMLHTLDLILLRVGIVLEQQRLAEEHRRALLESELEHMRSDFLRAISHDFRTPLTGIIGACSALEQQGVPLSTKERRELIDSIGEEAGWLLRMVENLLSVTRVGAGAPQLNRSAEAVEEVISEAVSRAAARFPFARFNISLPDSFLMIPMDPMLIVQVLMNLIENAVKYSGSDAKIDIEVIELEDEVRFLVRDYGKGLTEEAQNKLFMPSAGRSGDSVHGMGLGLSICRSVITAHGGMIEGRNNEQGGAEFCFTLPKDDAVG